MKKVYILQPASIDLIPNAPWGFYPYWAYAALKATGNHDPVLFDDLTLQGLQYALDRNYPDKDSDMVLILTNYGQLSTTHILARYLQLVGIPFRVSGLRPMVEYAGYEFVDLRKEYGVDLVDGALKQHFFNDEYESWILGECNGHVSSENLSRKMIPVFSAMGCSRKCGFCPVAADDHPSGTMSDLDFGHTLRWARNNVLAIHFMDEDFLMGTFNDKISQLIERPVPWIAMTSSRSLTAALKVLTPAQIAQSGCLALEIGLESMDSTVSGKEQELDDVLKCGIPIYWLTMTFLPSDSISSMRLTGDFLEKYGAAPEKMPPRMRLNSTRGSLGQFFIPYHGTKGFQQTLDTGLYWPFEEMVRQRPNYIGFKFLESQPKLSRHLTEDDYRWCLMYSQKKEIETVVDGIMRGKKCQSIIFSENPIPEIQKSRAMILAELARLGVLEDRR